MLNRASLEFPCPPDQLEVENLEGFAYRAVGCNDYASYECTENDDDGQYEYECKRAVSDGPEHFDAGV